MKRRITCLAAMARIVLALSFVAGAAATARGQWWTSYNPDLIVGEWTKASDRSYNRWTLDPRRIQR